MSSPSIQITGSVPGLPVVVPCARRRDDEVARMHRRALAVDRRIRAFAFDDEAQRGLRMAMRGRDLARQDELQPAIERARDRRLAAQAGILEHEDAALRFLRRDEPAGLEHVRTDGFVAPERRHAGRPRLGNHEVAEHVPERGHVLGADAGVERLAFRRRAGSFVESIGLHSLHPLLGAVTRRRAAAERVQPDVEAIVVCSPRVVRHPLGSQNASERGSAMKRLPSLFAAGVAACAAFAAPFALAQDAIKVGVIAEFSGRSPTTARRSKPA
jgi:hypothetical protein